MHPFVPTNALKPARLVIHHSIHQNWPAVLGKCVRQLPTDALFANVRMVWVIAKKMEAAKDSIPLGRELPHLPLHLHLLPLHLLPPHPKRRPKRQQLGPPQPQLRHQTVLAKLKKLHLLHRQKVLRWMRPFAPTSVLKRAR